MKHLIKRLIKLILSKRTKSRARLNLKRLATDMIDLGVIEYEDSTIKLRIHPDKVRTGNKIEYVLETKEQRVHRQEQEIIDKVKQDAEREKEYLSKLVGEY